MDALNTIKRLNEDFGPIDQYLGDNAKKVQLEGGQFVWSTNCVGDLKRDIDNINNSLGGDKTALKNDVYGHRAYSSSFIPELDVTEELLDKLTSMYQQLILVMSWSIELRRIDTLTEESCLSQHLRYPREVNIDAVYCIFRYLQKNLDKNPGSMKYDPTYEPLDENVF